MNISIQAKIATSVNFAAMHLKDVDVSRVSTRKEDASIIESKLIEKLEITSDEPIEVRLHIYTVPNITFEYRKDIQLQAGTNIIKQINLIYDDEFYRKHVTEKREGELKIELVDKEDDTKVLAFFDEQIKIQPYRYWGGMAYAYTLPAFLQPNDPLVASVVAKAGTKADTIGYQGRDRESVKEIARAIFDALSELEIPYNDVDARYENVGQPIRLSRMVLHKDGHQGTCLDLALLFCSCLRAAGLNSVVIIIPGHAFAAVMLEDNIMLSETPVVWGPELLLANSAKNGGVLLPVECTNYTLTNQRGLPEGVNMFDISVESAYKNLENTTLAVDVLSAEKCGICPVYTYVDQPICDHSAAEVICDVDEERRMQKANHDWSPIDKMKKQAMDITLRNNMLTKGNSELRLSFEFLAKPFLCGEYREKESALDLQVRKALITPKKTAEDLDKTFKRMRLNERDIKKESGKGNLYFTVNELKWKKDKEEYSSPLYLCPCEIIRNIRGELVLKVDMDEIKFNVALKEFLSQEYYIDTQEMKDFPGDEYDQQIEILKDRIKNHSEWTVVENVATIGFYNMPNEEILNALSDEELSKHPIVEGILQGKMSWDAEVPTRTVSENPTGIYLFQADSSQAAVIDSAGVQTAQVVTGPAGNGKTQTITNIVGEFMNAGRNVLFVTEKISAAEVLYKNLSDVHLDQFCLQLFDGKNSFNDVIAQVRQTLRFVEEYDGRFPENESDIDAYLAKKEKIETFVKSMKSKGECGLSLSKLIEMHANCDHVLVDLDYTGAEAAMNKPESKELVAAFAYAVKNGGKRQQDFTKYLKCENLRYDEKEKAKRVIDICLDKMDVLNDAFLKLEEGFLLSSHKYYNSEKERFEKMVGFSKLIHACPQIGEGLDELLESMECQEETPVNRFLEYIDVMEEEAPYTRAFKGAKREFLADADIALIGEMIGSEDFRNLSVLKQKVIENKWHLIQLDDPERFYAKHEKLQLVKEYQRCVQKLGEDGEVQRKLERGFYKIASGQGQEIVKIANKITSVYREEFLPSLREAVKLVVINEDEFKKNYPNMMKVTLLRQWQSNMNNRRRSKAYETICGRGREIGLTTILEQLEEHVEPDKMVETFEKAWYEYNISKLIMEREEIDTFDPLLYSIDINAFKNYEKKIRDNLHKQIIYKQVERFPKVEDGETDLAVINRLIRDRNSSVSIRSFFEQVPNLLLKMYPCIIMNPEAVAKYLPKGFPMFDMVIIDEGSQLPDYEAIIPISKGKQCLVFGDEKQMTPTSFFKRQQEDEEGYKYGLNSILDDVRGIMPSKLLRYHYRSNHESLIAFSNANFYDNELITFPSCDTAIKGVRCVQAASEGYDAGRTRTNELEAMRVIEEIENIYAELPYDTEETLGVITLNIAQKNLIEKKLVEAYAQNESDLNRIGGLISVVNLEACQGQEWSHVIISPAYSTNTKGGFSLNLGSISRADGANRLNVLITRAKKSLCVVTSLKSSMLDGSESAGTKVFKKFLEFAEGNGYQYDKRITDYKDEKNKLTKAIAEEVVNLGYEVHTNIGASECKVDIGIVSKENPNQYVMGILLDHYDDENSKSSVRDREIVFEDVLNAKGWNTYRIYSLNWYEDPQLEIRELQKALENLQGV